MEGSSGRSTPIRMRYASFRAALTPRKRQAGWLPSLLRYDEGEDISGVGSCATDFRSRVSYYLGVAYDGLRMRNAAQTAYEEAQRFSSFRSAAALRLGEMLARKGSSRRIGAIISLSPRSRRLTTCVRLKNWLPSRLRRALPKGQSRLPSGDHSFPVEFLSTGRTRQPRSRSYLPMIQLARSEHSPRNTCDWDSTKEPYGVLSRNYRAGAGRSKRTGRTCAWQPSYDRLLSRLLPGTPEGSQQLMTTSLRHSCSTSYVFPSAAEAHCSAGGFAGKSAGRIGPLSAGHALFIARAD